MQPNSLTQGSVAKMLFRFACPFLVANVLQSLYGAADLFVVGAFCGAQSVAAVSTGTQVTQIVTSLVTGLTLGSTVIIGQYTGQGEYGKVKRAIGTTLTVFACVALALTAGMLAVLRPLLRLLQTPQPAFELAVQYVTVCMLGNLFICGYNAISAVLRGWGDSRRPMWFVGIACAINIVLDVVFVRFLGLDVAGTALATVISQGVSMALAVVYLRRHHFLFDFRLPSFLPDKHMLKKLAVVGIPISFQELMVRISFLYLAAVMNRCGVYAASVVGISSKYDVFAMLSATSMASALAAITRRTWVQASRSGRAARCGMAWGLRWPCLQGSGCGHSSRRRA